MLQLIPDFHSNPHIQYKVEQHVNTQFELVNSVQPKIGILGFVAIN